MKKKIPGFLLVLAVFFSLVQCAKKGTPTGGPEDEEPPKFIRASPENFTTNFDKKEIRIFFNEYVKLNKPQQQIIISPPIIPTPNIMPLGSARKDVKIEIFDSLQPNTTYAINFGKSIEDNNEGNTLDYFKYVFSTGDFIDSLSISGLVEDASLKAVSEPVSIYLYEIDSAYTDSVVYKQTPRYVTYSKDSSFTFSLENLKGGTYQMVGIIDKNSNYLYNPGSEKIGFIDRPITIPTDSTFQLKVFKEDLDFEVKRPKMVKGNQIIFGYEGKTNLDSIEFNLLTEKPSGFNSRIIKDVKTDTLYYWYNKNIEQDSLVFEVVSPKRRDTLTARISQLDRDSLKLSTEPTGSIGLNKPLKLKANTPLISQNESFINILNQDSVTVPFTTELNLMKNEVLVSFDKTESNKYVVTVLPGAVTDLFQATNDTLRVGLNTSSLADYGNLEIRLQNIKSFPIIVQLTNMKGEVLEEQSAKAQTSFNFSLLNPGEYFIRVIYDSNGNNKWDTGNFLKRRQPEVIEYFRDTLEVRANFDRVETINLK